MLSFKFKLVCKPTTTTTKNKEEKQTKIKKNTMKFTMVIYVGWSPLDTGLLLKTKRPISDLTMELKSRLNMDPSDILGLGCRN